MTLYKKYILITIHNQCVGFWLSAAKILSRNYNIVIVCRNHEAKKKFRTILPDLNVSIECQEYFYEKKENINLNPLREACLIEKKYGETFTQIMSYDRGMGKGYISNAEKHPDSGKALWSHGRKIKELLKEFLLWEYIIDKYSPILILTKTHNDILSLIANYNRIRYLGLGKAKYGSRFMWIDNKHYQSLKLMEKTKEYVSKYRKLNKFLSRDYVHDLSSIHVFSRFYYDIPTSIKVIIKLFIYDGYRKIRGTYNRDSYKPWGWIPVILRRLFRYSYFKKYGKKPDELKGVKFVYVPLSQEPEISLSSFSPEFTNSMEMLTWVSKSLQADTFLVVREHPASFGVRSKYFHENLRRISNVILACPEASSWDWVKCSKLVVTISGTVGVEAVYFNKPVLIFGKHQIIRHLPTVRYANSLATTKGALNELLSISENDKLFKVSKEALYQAQMDVSFEMPGFEKTTKSDKLHTIFADVAIARLKESYDL